ncbi:N-acetyl-gamma-glutamyl-phosphate reductase [Moraxella caviae]|uniref:N-acetyl-gamma-glutamyl-phosphate reductase n=1 Tax=Moraxella caviae TaxID=34060 RepID=A0A1S9ZWN5_9GAMM|nr:N-acetyl-gamma-glutamyl-phosphate reductase [Moraxella caviae]OOR87850.1 N-acetyl-gamma-glutamyl-phosphate reductase [Moraxella caviae]STZ14885.1 N-acetyl-gamma-glutamyl-phosphate reductase [Moraxella caviae]VEW11206.1 N-acetyl-gamma-glutamyl-phosphate reductase [Moraxella caviae]VEW13694.1 N-acetyl-gamma-glutamyl-phosphate reductase [Moraxella caviae]
MKNSTHSHIQVGIVGGTGYTGVELIRLLSNHPNAKITLLTSRTEAGKAASEIFPSLRGVCDVAFSDADIEALKSCDVVFFATPHGVAMKAARELVASGTKVIDLAADFRLQDLAEFEKWYGLAHECPDIMAKAVYGLPEVNRAAIAKADVVGNPGCYPTTAILGLKPVIDSQNTQDEALIDKRIIIDAKSGISGAGRSAKLNLIFSESSDNFSAYGVAGHRHLPEIRQGVETLLQSKFAHHIRFVPHLVPMIRGMYSTIHLGLTDAGCALDWQAIFEKAYADEQFVDVLPKGLLPETRMSRASNFLRIGVHQDNDEGVLTVMAVQDNLVKGAAGQAVQNMNVMFGLDEKAGLNVVAVVP